MTGGTPLRILIFALGGEGGGVLMNWLVKAARASGHAVQATSVPGVAQRTGSTSYYIEIANAERPSVFNLVPMPGRVDILVASELVEAARAMELGFVSGKLTTLVASTGRVFTTDEKAVMGDGRFDSNRIIETARKMSKTAVLFDLDRIARENGTFISATLFGALDGSGALPWDRSVSEAVMGDGAGAEASLTGFRAAAVQFASETEFETAEEMPEPATGELEGILALGRARVTEYQDQDYGALYVSRTERLIAAADAEDFRVMAAVSEASRRLALWMAYEDIPRVAEMKTRPERFARIRQEVRLQPGQVIRVTEYLKPRAEELADMLPKALGERVLAWSNMGLRLPFVGRGIRLRSNAPIGYWLLRCAAAFRGIRRKSLRFGREQRAIEEWLDLLTRALSEAPDFAEALAALPRLRKGYSDTLDRGLRAYDRILDEVVRPALSSPSGKDDTAMLRGAIAAAMADDSHRKLDAFLDGSSKPSEDIPDLQPRKTRTTELST